MQILTFQHIFFFAIVIIVVISNKQTKILHELKHVFIVFFNVNCISFVSPIHTQKKNWPENETIDLLHSNFASEFKRSNLFCFILFVYLYKFFFLHFKNKIAIVKSARHGIPDCTTNGLTVTQMFLCNTI